MANGREVGADLVLLIGRLLQQAFGHHEADILPREQDLREAILHAAQAVGDVLEAAAVEDRFLHAGDETEAQVLRDLADLAQERQVEDEVVIPAGAEIVEELVDDEKNAVVRVNLGERRHHFLKGRLVVGHLVGGREGVADAVLFEEEFKLLRDDVPKGHLA